jgi:hypothetical protein
VFEVSVQVGYAGVGAEVGAIVGGPVGAVVGGPVGAVVGGPVGALVGADVGAPGVGAPGVGAVVGPGVLTGLDTLPANTELGRFSDRRIGAVHAACVSARLAGLTSSLSLAATACSSLSTCSRKP